MTDHKEHICYKAAVDMKLQASQAQQQQLSTDHTQHDSMMAAEDVKLQA